MKRTIVLTGVILLIIGVLTVVFSLVSFPFVTKEPYDVPRTSIIIREAFTVPVGETHRTASLNAGDLINIYFWVYSGGNQYVDFFVLDELNYLKLLADEDYSAQVSISRLASYNQNVTIPHNTTWCFVWYNSYSWITQIGVSTMIRKLWNDIAYRDTTVYHTVIPAEHATYTKYVGIGLVFVGILVIVWGTISEEKKPRNVM